MTLATKSEHPCVSIEGTRLSFRFRSWSELVSFAADHNVEAHGASHTMGSASWTGTADYDAADRLARAGWREGVEKMAPMAAALTDAVRPRKRKTEIAPSPVGPGSVSMGRYLMGHPKPYDRRRDTEEFEDSQAPRGVLRLLVNIGAAASISTEAIFARGAAACALADCLETAGYRVEIVGVWWMQPGRCDDRSMNVQVTLKQADQPLERDLMAFALAHPSTLRRLLFSVVEHAPASWRQAFGVKRGGGYSLSLDVPEERRQADIYLPTEHPFAGFKVSEDPAQWIREQLVKQGVEIES